MKKIISFYEKAEINKLLMLTFFLTVFSYMIFPFLAIYTINKGEITVTQVGTIIGIGAFSTSISSLFSAQISKRIGYRNTIVLGLIFISISYLGYVYAKSFLVCFLIILLSGIGQGMINPVIKSMIAIVKGEEDSSRIFRIRYMLLCFGIIVGPILGNLIYIKSVNLIFYLVFVSHILLIFFVLTIKDEKDKNLGENKDENKVKVKGLKMPIIIITLLSILVFTVFSIFESVTPIAINEFTINSSQVFSILIIYNSILALLIQPLIIILEKKFSFEGLFKIGAFLFAVAYLSFFVSKGNVVLLLISTTIFTLGEGILIPMLDTLVDKASTEEDKSAFFAFSELKQLGFFIGPALASLIIDKGSVALMYIITSILCLCVIMVFDLLYNIKFKIKVKNDSCI
ncbi:MFS transporter [Clostridium sp.]|uniref:MFS transporter n=1 Tax=Clostridium sp. TaxID=1506 RepID=UPI00262EFBDB|nr:MFS transporter [Clostridium sp.]